jgi:2-C-methyl-D-erythritol 4-phosphate cytidylyltransferase/2-C-methyl-D-erythritol 2,4-cyclodiphosphate synthase
LKQAGADGRAAATVGRDGKWAAQTPQMFRLALLERALDEAEAAGASVTDEASAVEALGLHPRLVQGDADNLKITWAADFARAQALLEMRMNATAANLPPLRLGEGWDTHALVAGRPLVLGGVRIPHSHGLLGHSDADALLHAITDALLGGAGLGDIGRHFPDTDAAFAGADSARLLQEARRRVHAAGWLPLNVDSTIVAQAPRMAPHIDAMRERIAGLLELPLAAVNVKAKTAEKMGPVGEGRAIEARAVCLLTALPGAAGSGPAA